MIKASELRKGVLIIDYTGCIREVYGEDIQQQCWYEEGQSGTTEAPLNPIPLTPEWLERMGYVKDSTEKKWYKSPHDLPPIYCWRMGDYGMDGLPLSAKSIQYVHQLQNLYFALTGEELNVKL